ncbi:MAG: VWA domain-containing protein [Bryobacteraceae bacterium]
MRASRLLALVVIAAAAQQEPAVKFSTSTNLVIVNVTVRDRRTGRTVDGLSRNDFSIFEDGKAQRLSVFEVQRVVEEKPLPRLEPLPKPGPLDAPPPPTPRQTAINSGPEVHQQYRDKRLLVLFFDFSSMQPPDEIRAQQAALKFIEQQMTSSDMVSIMTFSSGVKVEQDFTNDRELLREIVNGFRIGEMSDLAAEGDDADPDAGEDTGAAFVADEAEFNIFNTDRKLAALESAAKKLAALPEKKALVYFSSGAGKTGIENQSQLRATINTAVRSNVAFYPVDARGLTAVVPGGDATKFAPRGTGIFSGHAQNQVRARIMDQQETLTSLAADTGGKAFLDSNDLSLGVVQAQRDIRSYYILGYYSTNEKQDGRFRRIRVQLANNLNARLDYRSGYWGNKVFNAFTAEDRERQLTEALNLGNPVTDLPLAMEVDYFRISEGRYFVPVSIKIPGSKITLSPKETTEFDFIGQVQDERRKTAGSVRDGVKIKLTETDAASLAKRNVQYDTGFVLAPGAYRMKFVARENHSGQLGTFETRFTVPDLDAQDDALRVSSVVWSSQRVPLTQAVGAADKQKKLQAANPLVYEGQKLIPSITRVFRKDQSVYVYCEVYDPAGDPPSVSAAVTLFDSRRKVFESAPVRITQPHPQREGTLPVQFQLPLAKLSPGRYTSQINLIDETGRRFAFPRATLVVLR